MIGGRPFKVAVSPFQIMAIEYGIYQIISLSTDVCNSRNRYKI